MAALRVSIVAAVADNGVIGRGGGLPWRLPDDLRRFQRLTLGHALVMGRRTFESIGRPLPGRRNIVLTRDPEWAATGTRVAGSLPGALELAAAGGEDEAFVIGGAAVFQAALPIADRLYLTAVHAEVEGDVRFPELDLSGWRLVSEERHAADERHDHPFSFRDYVRSREAAASSPW